MAVREQQNRKKMIRDLQKIFLNLDNDGSGKVSMEELKGISQEDRQQLMRMMQVQDPIEIFRALDTDDSGELDVEEFCDGVWEVAISNVPIEMKRMEKQINEVHHNLRQTALEGKADKFTEAYSQ